MRAFVRAYAHEVGADADDLLENGPLGDVEEVADAPLVNVPIDEPSSSKSLFVGLALGVACTMLYSGSALPAAVPASPPAAVASVTDRVEPAAFAPPPCTPVTPAATPVHSARRPAVAGPLGKAELPAQPIPVTHVVPNHEIETSAAVVDSSPVMSDAILPTPDPASSTAPIEQF